ncbi:universal stress protein [Mariniflexile litorale]|uniref:Universal stress protein n=1 Tax=Mariniflexile litorale TaxID=3045158 RepID=A0AAU7EJY8_9FLAO|nr:universal stress protein [Mariniflexile sp. KMM 9835]MDQ8211234.1 universal stress protein [Mariniflexile sp. KMM 9835]
MKNILVPVGASENALSNLQYAVDFAQAFGAKLYVVQVYNVYTKAGTMIKIDHILEEDTLNYLNDLVSKVDTKNVELVVRALKGKFIDTIELVCKAAEIDLILIEPRIYSEDDNLFLGKTSGKIVKQTVMPTLIIPEGYVFKPIETILMAVKSAVIKKENVLVPLKAVKDNFKAVVNLLLVKTPYYNEGDFDMNEELSSLVTDTIYSDNPTTYYGVLEHYKLHNPDMLCVVRRKRGFFMKKWEKNQIYKKDFNSSLPVLVLSELK